MLDVVDYQLFRRTFEQDVTCPPRDRDRCTDQHQCDEKTDGRICVESVWRIALPNGNGDYHDAYVVDGIANDVDDHGKHAKIPTCLCRLSDVVAMFCVAVGHL